jgi:hypothetical protein
MFIQTIETELAHVSFSTNGFFSSKYLLLRSNWVYIESSGLNNNEKLIAKDVKGGGAHGGLRNTTRS